MFTKSLLIRIAVVLTLFCFTFYSTDAAIYKTTSAGGLWNSTSTWQGGAIPGSDTDTVIVRGTLIVNFNVTIGYLQVDTVGTVQNANINNYDLGVNIGINNYGIIKNGTSYNLGITLGGFLNQYGVMSNNSIRLRNTTIDINAEEPILCSSITNPYGPSFVNVLSDTLQFNNTSLNINGCTINFNNGVLILNGGALIYPDIYADNLDITLNSGAYIQGLECFANHVWLRGTVDIAGGSFYQNTSSLIVEVEGILQNRGTFNYVMNVEGDLINNGTIQNNFYALTLNISGDLINNGTWTNETTNLDGDEVQHLSFNMPFSGASLINTNSNNYLVAETDLEFNNTHVDFNNDTLYFNFNSGNLILNGGYFREFNMMGASPSYDVSIDLNSNAYIYGAIVTFSEIHLLGTYQFQSTMIFNGNVTVEGILQNDDTYTHTATINGNLTNNGTISNNYYALTLNITNDLINNGTWTNQTTNLSGATDQSIYLNSPFNGSALNNTNGSGKVIAQTDLEFNNTVFDMNADTLVFAGAADSLVVNQNNVREVVIVREAAKASGSLKINLLNGAWVWYLIIYADQVDIYGNFQFGSFMRFYASVVINHGILNNYASSNYTAEIYGNFHNNGTVTNNYYNLNLEITGDIYQNGQWLNYNTDLTGDLDQHLNFTEDFNGSFLTNSNTTGKIISNTNLKFNNTLFDLSNDTLLFAGGADSLVINQNYLNDAIIIRDDAAKASGTMKIFLTNSAYVQNLNVFADEIKLYGIYQFSQTMNFHGKVTVYGTLQNRDNGNFTVNMSSNLVNKGIIQNNFYNLTLNVAGDLWQQGTWTCQNTNLNGASDQNLHFDNDFNGQYFTNTNNDGKIIANTDLIFNNTIIDLNNDTLEFAGAADSLKLNGQYLIDAIVTREAAKASGVLKYNLTGGSYTNNLITAADEIILYGIFQFSFTMQFYGNVTVMDLFQNRDNGNFSAYVYGDLNNYGTITNNYYNLSLYLYGNINQHGSWTVYYTYLSSASDQTIDLSHPLAGSFFVDNNAGSNIIAASDLVFQGLSVDLNGAALMMPPNAVLAVKGGYLRETDITNEIELYMENDSYIEDVSLISPTFSGTVQFRNNIAISGHVIVYGVLQNDDANNYNVTINGSVENHGTIQDNYYQLRLFIQEDIINNGAWTNTWTQLEGYAGSINQTVELQDGHYIDGQLRLFANNSSNFAWYKNGNPLIANPDYSGATSQVLQFLVPADNIRAGVYNCNTLAGWSRDINIFTTSSAYPEVSLTVMLEGPFNGTEMNTGLNDAGSLPLVQPYDVFGFNYLGSENVASIPNPGIVDWVLIEFRDAVDGNNADQSTRINRQPAFLLSDGSVVGLDGTSNLTVPHNFVNGIFVIVHHRNHLGVMSAVQLNEVAGIYTYDFSYDSWNAYGGPNASKNIGTDLDPVYGMMGGDAEQDGDIDASDRELWLQSAGDPSVYNPADHNMDGQVNNQDKNDIWYENRSYTTQYPQ